MTFKEWEELPPAVHYGPLLHSRMYADWKADREKLIGALENCLGFIDELKDHGISKWSREMQAQAILTKVKEKL